MSSSGVAGNDDPIGAAIDAAEEVLDPLDGLAGKTASDPGAAFAPEVLERLATLRQDDRAAFEALTEALAAMAITVPANFPDDFGKNGGT
jgi:hypothetical protein